MRAFGRDLIRGGHYSQRSCEPHLQAEHMAAPTNAAYVKRALANSEPSTQAVHTWHLTDVPECPLNGRYWGQSGYYADRPKSTRTTQSRHGRLFLLRPCSASRALDFVGTMFA